MAIEVPAAGDLVIAHDQAGTAVVAHHAKPGARFDGRRSLSRRGHQRDREVAIYPLCDSWRPETHLASSIVADNHVEIPVGVGVEQSHAVVATVSGPKRMSSQQILRQPLVRFTKIQKLDLLAILLRRVVDQLDDLLALDPLVGMKDER